tara:strand:- start:360 stop:1184 length:825 start_codon:yes stop_codon:yes gene_type:complete
MNLWIITVNFGNTQPTEKFIDSLLELHCSNMIKVGIADNASTSESFSKLAKIKNQKKIDIEIFSNEKNLYYWPAAKRILNEFKKSIGSYPDWVMICNNDITFTHENFLEILMKIEKKYFPIIGPNIISKSGKKINPFLISAPSFLNNLYWKLYYSSFPLSVMLSLIKKMYKIFSINDYINKKDNIKEVYAVHGSAILFSDYFFEKGGWLDDNFDLFGEEITVAEIAKKLDIPITYFPELIIAHHEHSSTKKLDKKTLYLKGKQCFHYLESAYKK